MWAGVWAAWFGGGRRGLGKLTVKGLEKLTEPGRYGDGAGLWLQIRKPDAGRKEGRAEAGRSWLFRYARLGRQRQMGLGPYPDVGLAEARDRATQARRLLRLGSDPIGAKQARAAEAAVQAATMTFKAVAELYLTAHEGTWRNAKHRYQWRQTLESYVYPVMGGIPVAAVEIGAVMKVIEPLWTTKPETAARVRGRVETIIDYATARGWRTGENPARWRGHVENLLPARSKVAAVVHHAALPWAEMGAFMAALVQQGGTAALALRFTILTAARTTEAIEARWQEIDMDHATWTVPGQRMKAGREHRVPLSDAAIDVLHTLLPGRSATGGGFVFSGQRPGTPLSNMAMTALLRRMGRGAITVHGFRSTFRQWAGDNPLVAREVAEAALAHALKDKTEAAYARGDLFDRRRVLMEKWAEFCATEVN
jgi:integrase